MKTWFKAKRYGYDWYPASWQGWTIMLIWLALVTVIFRTIDKNSHSVSDTLIGFFVPFVLLLALLIFIAYGTGKKPSWRWGNKKL